MDGSESTAISRGTVEDTLAHFGKLGMKWGRRSSTKTGEEFTKHMNNDVNNSLAHISEKPWSDYTSADYTVEQWHTACLIHQHDGAPTSKGQCKLPVKTPSGVVNQNGVYSAAAALGGARGGVIASENEKTSAAQALIRLYKEMDKQPPPSLLSHSSENILSHWGKLGMKWGRRKSRETSGESGDQSSVTLSLKPGKGIVGIKGGKGRSPETDAKKAAEYRQIANKSGLDALSNDQIRLLTGRIDLEKKYAKAMSESSQKSSGRQLVENTLKNEGKSLIKGNLGPIALGVAALAASGYLGYKGTHRKSGAGLVIPSSSIKSLLGGGSDYVGRHTADYSKTAANIAKSTPASKETIAKVLKAAGSSNVLKTPVIPNILSNVSGASRISTLPHTPYRAVKSFVNIGLPVYGMPQAPIVSGAAYVAKHLK